MIHCELYKHSLTEEAQSLYRARDAEAIKALILKCAEDLREAPDTASFNMTYGTLAMNIALYDSLVMGGEVVSLICDYINV